MPRRSRGCKECRQKRIGCDGGSPSCRHCLLAHRRCSGTLDGPIVIDQTKLVASRYQQTSRAPPHATPLQMIRNPSPKAIISLAFVSHFLHFLTSTGEGPSRRPWPYAIIEIPVDEKGPALDLAMQAVATAYCGVASRNPLAVREACELYGKALSQHSSALSLVPGTSTTSKICTAVILSIFEAIWPTNPTAYATHLTACRELLGSASPDLEDSAVLRPVAIHVQYQALFALTTTSHSNSTLETDMQTPIGLFRSEPQHAADRLTNEILGLQKLVRQRNQGRDISIQTCHDTASRIDDLWAEYQEKANEQGRAIELPSRADFHYRDAFTAMTVTYFASARILLSLISFPISAEHTDSFGNIAENGQLILDCASFLIPKDIGCAHLRLFLPLTLVAKYSTSSEQRFSARTLLERRHCGNLFNGLSYIAIEQLQTTNEVDQSFVSIAQGTEEDYNGQTRGETAPLFITAI